MTTLDAGWGGGAWGDAAWGAAEPDLTLDRAASIAENVVRLAFSVAPLFTLLGNSRDASRLDHYSVMAVSADARPVGLVEVAVAADAGASLDLTVDRPFSPWPAVYRVSAVGLVSSGGTFLAKGSSATFLGQLQGRLAVDAAGVAVAGRDIANPQSARDLVGTSPDYPSAALGTYQIGPDGDYVSDHPFASYRKRVLRRVATRLGGFAHLLRYGAGAGGSVKRQASATTRQSLANLVEEQIKLEPETLDCRVAVVTVGSLTYLRIRVTTNLLPDEVLLGDVPLPLAA